MNDILNLLFDVLKEKKSPLAKLFNEGLSRRDIDSLLDRENISISFTDELYSLYQWRNGINIFDDSGIYFVFFPLAAFVPLDILTDAYNYYAIANDYWEKNLFPVFANLAGDFYLLDIDPQSATFKKIFKFSPSNASFLGAITVFDSLQKLLETVIVCYKTEIYKYDLQQNFLVVDPIKEYEVAKDINRDSEYWKLF